MTVIYADSVFFLNAITDYFLLLATARLAGILPHRKRCLAAAVCGGAYAVVCFFPGMQFLAKSAVKAAFGVLLALITFGGETYLLRLTVLFFAVSCAFAGCVLSLGMLSGGSLPVIGGVFYTDISFRVLLIAATAAYLVFSLVFRASARHHVRGEMLPVRLCVGGRVLYLSALHDTGNGLRDPVSGRPVLVLSRGILDPLLPTDIASLFQTGLPAEELMLLLRKGLPQLHPCLLPYRAAGMGEGLLPGIKSDWFEVGGCRFSHGMVAILPEKMEVSALWGGEKGIDV